jgi:hypothetical protein
MTDLTPYVILTTETVFVGGGTIIATRVARLTGRPPRGWLMLIAAFATQLIQAICYFFVYFGPAGIQASAQSVGQWLGVPALGFVFAGTYFLFRDFARQLSQRQAAILNPES